MVAQSAYDWVRFVERAILDLDTIPQFGNIPSFCWEEFSEQIAHLFTIPHLKIRPTKSDWYSPSTIAENLGEDALCLNFSVLPLQGKASLIFSPLDANKFVTWLAEKRKGDREVLNTEFIRGFLAYVSAETMNFLQKQSFFDGFLLRYITDKGIPSARALGVDICLEAYKEKVSCRLVLPEMFRKNWISYHLERPKHFTLESLKMIEVPCGVTVGHIQYSSKEWKAIRKGDFIPVPNGQVDLDTKKGSLHLSIGNKELYRVRLKDGGIKILEQTIYEEDSMYTDDGDDHDDYEDMLDDDLDDEESSDAFDASDEEEYSEEAMLDKDEDAFEDEEEPLENKSTKAPTMAGTLGKIEHVPLSISVELTRFRMTCEKLLQLKPGNLLELNVHLEKPVDLVANGKVIAQGELIRVGEVLGVRILNIG